MLRNITLLSLLILASACGIDYDGEKRLVFETRITDKNNNPIGGEHVRIQVLNGEVINGYFGGENGNISDGYSDANGNIRLIFPAPSAITNTMTVHYEGNAIHQEKHIYNIKVSDFLGYKLSFNPMKLYRNDEITTLNVQANNTGGNQMSISAITINGVRADQYFNYQTQAPFPEEYNYYNSEFIKNQNVTVSYTIFDHSTNPSTATEHNDIVSIGNEPVTYTINY